MKGCAWDSIQGLQYLSPLPKPWLFIHVLLDFPETLTIAHMRASHQALLPLKARLTSALQGATTGSLKGSLKVVLSPGSV